MRVSGKCGPRLLIHFCAVLTSLILAGSASAEVVHARRSTRAKNTISNIAPLPNFMAVCNPGGFDESARCLSEIDAAFQHALASERVSIRFNAHLLSTRSPAVQLFIAANIDRVARGLPPFEDLLSQLNSVAKRGVEAGTDPSIAQTPNPVVGGQSVVGWGSNWGLGTYTALGAEYFWMYEDGANGYNLACRGSWLDGCQGHRANILATYAQSKTSCTNGKIALSMGSAFAMTNGAPSFGEIFIATCNPPTSGIVATWSQVGRFAAISNRSGHNTLSQARK